VIGKLLVGVMLLIASPVAVAAVIVGPTDVDAAPTPLAVSEIPSNLLPVYRSAALTCHGLPWHVLAAIGWEESRHGQGRVDPVTGDVDPPIEGPPLDGRPGFALLRDSSMPQGYDRALGPMQFLSSTWDRWATVAPDRPPDATPDVQNAWDAIFTAARYLCSSRDGVDDLRQAILSYNRSEAYVRAVFEKARAYGMGGPADSAQLINGSGDRVVAVAMTQLGAPYVWGGASSGGFDCSGLVQWAYSQNGVALPRTTSQQLLVGLPVGAEELRPGDLVFSRSIRDGRAVAFGHVAIYAGGGQVIVAPRTGDVVSLRPLRSESRHPLNHWKSPPEPHIRVVHDRGFTEPSVMAARKTASG
jgi:cell wall-associated NlpC family hydrolase